MSADPVEPLRARIAGLERQIELMRAAKPSPYMTPKEAAAYLRLFDDNGAPDPKKLYTLRCRYHLRARKVGGLLRFHVNDLDAFAGATIEALPASNAGKGWQLRGRRC